MVKHKLLTKLSIGIASLALICPLALGKVSNASASEAKPDQTNQPVNKPANNQNKQANNVVNNKNKNKPNHNDDNEIRLGSRHGSNNSAIILPRNHHKIHRYKGYSFKNKRHHFKKNMKNLRKHHKGLYSKLRNKRNKKNKRNKRNRRINRHRHMRIRNRKHMRKHVNRHSKRHMKRIHLKKHGRKRKGKKHTVYEPHHYYNVNHASSASVNPDTNADNETASTYSPSASVSTSANDTTSNNMNNNSSNNNASVSNTTNATPTQSTTDNLDNAPADIGRNTQGYTNWYSQPDVSDPVINEFHINKHDAAYYDNHAYYEYNTPFPRKHVIVQAWGTPTERNVMTKAELDATRNPFRNWTQSQFDNAVKPMINGYNNFEINGPDEGHALPWTAITKAFTDADPNYQQAENVAEATWDD